MSTKLYPNNQVKPANWTNDGFPQYLGKACVRKEFTFDYTQEINPIPGKSFEINIEFTDRENKAKNGTIQDHVIEINFTNASGDGTLTFNNVYKMFKSVELRENGVQVDKLRDMNEVFVRASENLFRENMKAPNDWANEVARNLNLTGETLPYFTVSNSGTAYLRLSLLNLFPKLANRHTQSFGQLKLIFSFCDSGSVGDVALFCASSTTTNNYATIVANSIKIRTIVLTNPDPRLILNTRQDWNRMYDTVVRNGAFNTAGTDYAKVNLKNDFTSHENCVGMYIYAESPDNRAAYNSANASMYATLPETICPVITLDGETILDHKDATTKLIDRRRYCLDVHKSNWSTSLDPLALGSGNMSKMHMPVYYIDFKNLPVAENQEEVLCGIPSSTNLDIQAYCGSTGVDANNTNVYFVLVYLQCVDRSSGVPRILLNSVNSVYSAQEAKPKY